MTNFESAESVFISCNLNAQLDKLIFMISGNWTMSLADPDRISPLLRPNTTLVLVRGSEVTEPVIGVSGWSPRSGALSPVPLWVSGRERDMLRIDQRRTTTNAEWKKKKKMENSSIEIFGVRTPTTIGGWSESSNHLLSPGGYYTMGSVPTHVRTVGEPARRGWSVRSRVNIRSSATECRPMEFTRNGSCWHSCTFYRWYLLQKRHPRRNTSALKKRNLLYGAR